MAFHYLRFRNAKPMLLGGVGVFFRFNFFFFLLKMAVKP